MDKVLVNKKSEYYNLFRSIEHWDETYFKDDQLDKISDSYLSRPEKYPCVVCHDNCYNWQRGRTEYSYEFVYLEDFELDCCKICGDIFPDNQLIWEYSEKIPDGCGWICKNCYYLEVEDDSPA
jgi:hypothetical protein